MRTLLLAASVLGVMGWSLGEHVTTQRLQRELAERRQSARPSGGDGLAPPSNRVTSVVPAAVAPSAPAPAAVGPTPPTPAIFPIGEWRAASTWENRGSTTPRAAVETLLWAAAGGDVATMQSLLVIDDALRDRLAAVLARSGDANRYPGPEALLAAFTIKCIPIGDAQLVWQTQPAPDESLLALFLRNPPTPIGAAIFSTALAPPAPAERVMTGLPTDPETTVTYLSLRRVNGTWRFIVPPSAVDRIEAEFASRPAP